ncbi:MAG: hypothetical protein Kow0029_07820 [Candidatus Rifleibacteriota bacterium]
MAVIVHVQKPKALLAKIYKSIDDKKVLTWKYDGAKDFYHTPEQWSGEGWFRPTIAPGLLVFGLIGRKDTQMTKMVYGAYHGRFIEMLLAHFDNEFTLACATAQMESEIDSFK